MKKIILQTLTLAILAAACVGSASAQEKPKSRFSHKGIKAAMGLGRSEISNEPTLDKGKTFDLNLGYGFSNRSTLWLTVMGAEHENLNNSLITHEFAAGEISYQYKFSPDASFQPYGRIGIGGYQLKQRGSNVANIGGGVVGALGVDFFLNARVGIGAELYWKDIEFGKQTEDQGNRTITTDLDPKLNRDTKGFRITLTLQ